MPATKTIPQLYLEQQVRFMKQLKRAESIEEEDLHKLRVEIKNLRVLFEFLRYSDIKKLKINSALEALLSIFKKAGKIRSIQLNLKLSKTYTTDSMTAFRGFLQKQEKKAKARFRKELNAFDKESFKTLHKKNLKVLEKCTFKISQRNSEAFVRRSFVKVRTALFHPDKNEALHEVRKQFKIIKNMGRLLAEINQRHSLSAEIKKTEAFYEKIGQWHDELMFIESFETYVLKKIKPEERKDPLSSISQFKRKNEKMKLRLIQKLKKDLN